MSGVFFDTNVLLYLISDEARKADTAETLLLAGGHVSVQVLAELTAVCRRKYRMAWEDIESVRNLIKRHCKVHAVTSAMHSKAFALASHSGYTIYDAQILAAAALAGCSTVWSEDMQDRHRVAIAGRTVEIRNPFAQVPNVGV